MSSIFFSSDNWLTIRIKADILVALQKFSHTELIYTGCWIYNFLDKEIKITGQPIKNDQKKNNQKTKILTEETSEVGEFWTNGGCRACQPALYFTWLLHPSSGCFWFWLQGLLLKKLEKALEKEKTVSKMNGDAKRPLQDRMEEQKGIRSDVDWTDGMRKSLVDFARGKTCSICPIS